jgi:RNA polymerase sigma factor (sigma-70 family)
MIRTEWVTTTRDLQALKTSGDRRVWQKFHNHFYPVIVKFAQRMGLAEQDAEDAAQEAMVAFIKAYRKGGYDPEKGRLTQWVFGVARKVIMNRQKRLPPERQILDRSTGTGFWNLLQDGEAEALKGTWDAEWRKMVLDKCLDRVRGEFGDRIFQAFEMYALNEVPAEKVAQALRMTKNAVYIAKNRVLTRLRQLEGELETVDDAE